MTVKNTSYLKTCLWLPGLDVNASYRNSDQTDAFIFFLLNQLSWLDLPGIHLTAKKYLPISDRGYVAEITLNEKNHLLVLIFEEKDRYVDLVEKILVSLNDLVDEERKKEVPERSSYLNHLLKFLGLKKGLLNYHLIRTVTGLYVGCLPEKISPDIELNKVPGRHLPALRAFPVAAFSYQTETGKPLTLLVNTYEKADAAALSKLTGLTITYNGKWQVTTGGNQQIVTLNCNNSYHGVINKLNELTSNSGARLHITTFPWNKELIFFVGTEQEQPYQKLLFTEEEENFKLTNRKKAALIEAYLLKNGLDTDAAATLSTCYGNIREHSKVLEIIEKYLPLDPKNFVLLNNKLMSFALLKEYEKGVEAGKAVLALSTRRYNTHYFMAVCYMGLERFEEAIASSHNSLKDDPNRPYNFFQLGYTYYAMNNYDLAIENYKLATQADPGSSEAPIPSAFYNLACIYSLQNKIQKSAEAFRKSVELNPKYRNDLHEDEELENLRNAMSEEELFGKGNV